MTRPPPSANPIFIRVLVQRIIDEGMRCNCDLDNWEPEPYTGHSWVCRIHKEAMRRYAEIPPPRS